MGAAVSCLLLMMSRAVAGRFVCPPVVWCGSAGKGGDMMWWWRMVWRGVVW